MKVKVPGLRRLDVDQQPPASDLGSELRGATNGVGEKAGSESSPLMVEGHAKTSEQRHRLRVPSRTLANPRGASSIEMPAIDQGAEMWLDVEPDETEDDAVIANDEELRRLPSAIALYRSGQALMTGNIEHATTYADRAFDLAGTDDHLERGGATGLAALTHWSRADLDAAYNNWATAIDNLKLAGHYSDVAGCSISMADIRITQGRLSDALEIYHRGLRLTTEARRSRSDRSRRRACSGPNAERRAACGTDC